MLQLEDPYDRSNLYYAGYLSSHGIFFLKVDNLFTYKYVLAFRLQSITETMNYTRVISQISIKGKKLHEEKQLRGSVVCYDQAYMLSTRLVDEDLRKTCALNLAAAHLANDDPTKALEYLIETEPVQEDAKGDLYYNFGLAYERKGQCTTTTYDRK